MTRREWKTGEMCGHGELGRSCVTCEMREEIEELREEQKLLLALLEAAREWDDCECPHCSDEPATCAPVCAILDALDDCEGIKTKETP